VFAFAQVFRQAQEASPSVEASINIASTLNDLGNYADAEIEMRAGLLSAQHTTGVWQKSHIYRQKCPIFSDKHPFVSKEPYFSSKELRISVSVRSIRFKM